MAATNSDAFVGIYDTSNVYFTADNKTIYGFGDSTLFTFTYTNNLIAAHQDPQGVSTAGRNHKTGGTFTVTLSQMSPANAIFDQLADSQGNDGFAVDACDGARHYVAPHCFVEKKADGGAANDQGERTWTINALNVVENYID